jgi:predicted aspartyl protease
LRFLDSLIGGNVFIIKIIVHKNGIAVGLKALVDIGAQAWILADQKFCEKIANR